MCFVINHFAYNCETLKTTQAPTHTHTHRHRQTHTHTHTGCISFIRFDAAATGCKTYTHSLLKPVNENYSLNIYIINEAAAGFKWLFRCVAGGWAGLPEKKRKKERGQCVAIRPKPTGVLALGYLTVCLPFKQLFIWRFARSHRAASRCHITSPRCFLPLQFYTDLRHAGTQNFFYFDNYGKEWLAKKTKITYHTKQHSLSVITHNVLWHDTVPSALCLWQVVWAH